MTFAKLSSSKGPENAFDHSYRPTVSWVVGLHDPTRAAATKKGKTATTKTDLETMRDTEGVSAAFVDACNDLINKVDW